MADPQELEAIEQLSKDYASKESLAVVSEKNLSHTSTKLSLNEYIIQIWNYRHFTFEHARHRARADNDDMFLGRLWTILEPALRITMYGLIFGFLLNTSRGIENFVGFLIIGVMFFAQISKGISGGSGLIQRSRSLTRTFNFPRASLVIGEGIRSFLSSLIPASLAVVAALGFQWGKPLSYSILVVPPIVILMHIFALGLMFLTARITAFLPDAKKIIFFINRAWFYVSGVFFSVERYAKIPVMQQIMSENPAYRFLQAVRGAVMYNQVPPLTEWGVLSAWAFGSLIFGFLFFWSAEGKYVHVR